MKTDFNSYFIIFVVSTFLLSCLNKEQKPSEKKSEIQKNIISSVKRVPDSTKNAFEDIEFGMTQEELFQTRIFKKKSKKDLVTSYLSSLTIMEKKLKKNNLSEDMLKEEHIVEANDVLYVTAIDKIGRYEYNIGANFYKNSLYFINIHVDNNEKLENILEIIKIKYKKPKEYKLNENVPPESSTYYKYEWSLKTKNIKISQSFGFMNRELLKINIKPKYVYWYYDNYMVEIYSEEILNKYLDSFKYTLNKIEDKKQFNKKKDSDKF